MVLRDAFPALRRGAFGVLQGIHIAHGARMAGMHSMRRYWIAAGYIDSERAAVSNRMWAVIFVSIVRLPCQDLSSARLLPSSLRRHRLRTKAIIA